MLRFNQYNEQQEYYSDEEEAFIDKIDSMYPEAGKVVSGLNVDQGPVDNIDSISATWTEYEVLPGIREVPHTWSFNQAHMHKEYILKLKAQIEKSNRIMPLIVAIDYDSTVEFPSDDNYPYILEGQHRSEALGWMRKKTIPAIVVIGFKY